MPNIKAKIHKSTQEKLDKDIQIPALHLKKKRVVSFKRVQIKIKCTNKKQYLLNGQCLTESIVLQAKFMANIPGYKEKVYLGVSETTFKVHYGNQKKSFTKQRQKKKDTELSKEYWKIKHHNGIPLIKWKVLRKSNAYNRKNLCYA